jgi:predicted RNase H-like HicB family nuclease
MLSEYIRLVMEIAQYEMVEDDRSFFGTIPGFDGLWAEGKTLEECRRNLQGTLEDWIVLSLRLNKPTPVLKGIDLSVKEVA